VLRRLPLAVYQLRVRQDGFADFTRPIEIRSAVPQSVEVILQLGELLLGFRLAPKTETFHGKPRRHNRTGVERSPARAARYQAVASNGSIFREITRLQRPLLVVLAWLLAGSP
jgi:hypothetical protein